MTKSLINTIYQEVATQTIDKNPIYSVKANEITSKILETYSNRENRLELDSDLGELIVETEYSAFAAGFKVAMNLVAQGAAL